MYRPASFRADDRETAFGIIDAYPFATIVSRGHGGMSGNHLPLLLARDRGSNGSLLGHMARANPQWKEFESGGEVLVMFQGPHAYVSPRWYKERLNVPTWNYVTVHAYGKPRIMTSEVELWSLLERLVGTFEARAERPWRMDLPGDFVKELLGAIVGFEIPISRLEGKLKLSQNRDPDDARGALAGLSESADPMARDVAAWMRRIGVGGS
jgi:transcriptional regulator